MKKRNNKKRYLKKKLKKSYIKKKKIKKRKKNKALNKRKKKRSLKKRKNSAYRHLFREPPQDSSSKSRSTQSRPFCQ